MARIEGHPTGGNLYLTLQCASLIGKPAHVLDEPLTVSYPAYDLTALDSANHNVVKCSRAIQSDQTT